MIETIDGDRDMGPGEQAGGLEKWLWRQGDRAGVWFVVYGLLMLVQVNGYWWKPGGDQVKYLSMARELAEHGRLRALGDLHLYHAPGFGILMTPAFWFGEAWQFYVVQLMQWGWLMVAVWASYVWARWYVDRGVAVLIAGIVGINANVWLYVHQPLSEVSFMAFFMLSVLSMEKMRRAEGFWRVTGWVCLSAALVGYASLIRQVGVLAVGGLGLVVLCDLIKGDQDEWRGVKGWLKAVVSVGFIGAVGSAVAVGFVMYDRATLEASGGHSYVQQVFENKGFLMQLLEGVHGRVNAIGQLMMPGLFKTYAKRGEWLEWIMLLYVPVTGLFVWGWWRFARRHRDILAWLMVFYVGLYLVWPFTQNARFFVPVLAMFGMCVWEIVKRWPNTRLSIMAILIVLQLLAGTGRTINHWKDTAKANAKWDGFNTLVQPMVRAGDAGAANDLKERGLIAAYPLGRAENDMLMFISNRDFVRLDRGTMPSGKVLWVFVRSGEALPVGYKQVGEEDGIVLGEKE